MIKNYFKIAWRNLRKNKVYSFINVFGLATGMAVALLIGLWIRDEVTFNSYHQNHKRLAQLMTQQTMKGTETETDKSIPMPWGDVLRTKYSDLFKHVSLTSWNDEHLLAAGDKKISGNGMWAQQDFPEMFSLVMIKGNRDALKDPSFVLIDQSMAKAIFGNDDPINKVVRVDNGFNIKVGGVYEDIPHNSDFYDTKILFPWAKKENWRNSQTDWHNHCGQLFVELNEPVAIASANTKVKKVPTPYVEEWKEEMLVYPLDRLHLYGEFKNAKEAGGRIQFVWLFGIIGVFVLLLACINFMNLSTARSEKRAKEVGIRKTIGSLRSQLIAQFLSESILVALLAFVFSLLMVELSIGFFNGLADKQMSIPWGNPVFWSLTLGFALITGIVSGSYPAFYLSAFEPIKVLKGAIRAGRLASLPRKVLVVLQFTVSITLIIGTIIVFRQIQYAKDLPVGYNREGLITVGMNSPDLWGHYDPIRNDLLATGAVENMAESSYSTTNFGENNGMEWRGKDPSLVIFFRDVNVTFDFGKTVGWKIIQGRDFSKEFTTDSSAVILNEATAKILGFKNPVGEVVKMFGENRTVIGVVKNMITESPYEPIAPAVFLGKGWMSVINIKMKPNIPVHEALSKIESVFKKYNPNYPFVFKFTDEQYAKKFSAETRVGNLATFFAILAIFISCLGLFGLASFVAEQRTKEIGVRKVLGASIFNLWKLLSKEFVALVIISCLIAVPISSYFLNKWLTNYVYHTQISWWVFITAGAGALIITLLTVSYQGIKAALMNPVKSLRTE